MNLSLATVFLSRHLFSDAGQNSPSEKNVKRNKLRIVFLAFTALTTQVCNAQSGQPEPAANVISGTVAAIGYPVGGGSTKVTMVGTSAASSASGDASVGAKVAGTVV